MALPLLHHTDGLWLLNGDARPVLYSPYESHVTGCILRMHFTSGDGVEALRTDLVERFNRDKWTSAMVDNKTVFVVDFDGKLWSLGFYDLTFSLGTSFRRTW